ncbi:MAG: hypothetical protein FWD92_04460 [Methanomassiliicoccaceae archaeon]|nr:hypothetical protein [Methanomassiliicoccaceae archaeon]
MEYDHMEELGFSEDKQTICTASGFLDSKDPMKGMCDRFIRNGGKMYDVLMAYDNIQSFELNTDIRKSGDSLRTLVPLLKASGATDSSVQEYFMNNMRLMPGCDAMHHLNRMMSTLIVSESYEHHAAALCDAMNLSPDVIRCTEISFDGLDMSESEKRRARESIVELSKLNVPKVSSDKGARYLDNKDETILIDLEDITLTVDDFDLMYQLGEMKPMGGNEKAFALMDLRRRTEVDLDRTAYVGSNSSDFPAMDIVRDNEGLAMSFNGDEYAVRGSNVAVMSSNSIVAAVLISEFYSNGLEGVFSLIGAWDRGKLTEREHPDRHLMNTMLKTFPSKLPDVVIVNDDNMSDVIKESERFRRKSV